ncbi:hypothetical protein SKAU_G00080050 [Synaphobranchus kaupii]|uniref:Uncharacterized protein n=1 Tax=Synaphobranchus kaupii TaxID=118154 RepID=A0A9Q1FUQ6_SYNKA|nr:hypothetical protein SKAU_G00080050 [Synaphobranchus kaupii]
MDLRRLSADNLSQARDSGSGHTLHAGSWGRLEPQPRLGLDVLPDCNIKKRGETKGCQISQGCEEMMKPGQGSGSSMGADCEGRGGALPHTVSNEAVLSALSTPHPPRLTGDNKTYSNKTITIQTLPRLVARYTRLLALEQGARA